MSGSLRRAVIFSLPFVAILLVACWLNPAENYWLTVEPPKAQCEAYDVSRLKTSATLTSKIYDQRKLDQMIREPQNTFSNFAYVIVGLAILLAGKRAASRNLGLAGIFLGFGSGMYHASLLPEWRMIDILGVYAVLYGLVLVGVSARYSKLSRGSMAVGLILLTWAMAIYTGVHRNDVRLYGFKVFDSTYVFIFAVTIGCTLAALTYWRAPDRRRYYWAAAVLTVSAIISFSGGVGDRFGGFWACPDGLIQGHAVWHAFGAVAMLAAYELFAMVGYDRSTLK